MNGPGNKNLVKFHITVVMFWQKLEWSDTLAIQHSSSTTIKCSFYSQRIHKYISTLIGENQNFCFWRKIKNAIFMLMTPYYVHSFPFVVHFMIKHRNCQKKKKNIAKLWTYTFSSNSWFVLISNCFSSTHFESYEEEENLEDNIYFVEQDK